MKLARRYEKEENYFTAFRELADRYKVWHHADLSAWCEKWEPKIGRTKIAKMIEWYNLHQPQTRTPNYEKTLDKIRK